MVEKPKLCGCSMNDAGLCHFISVRCIIEINQINVTLCRIVICSFGYLQFKVFRRSAATHNMTISWCVRVECVKRGKKTQRRIHIVRKISKQYLARVSVHSTKLCYDFNEFFIFGFGCGFKSTCWIRQRYFLVTWSCNVFFEAEKKIFRNMQPYLEFNNYHYFFSIPSRKTLNSTIWRESWALCEHERFSAFDFSVGIAKFMSSKMILYAMPLQFCTLLKYNQMFAVRWRIQPNEKQINSRIQESI